MMTAGPIYFRACIKTLTFLNAVRDLPAIAQVALSLKD
jgi:hypothetical protein